MSTIVPVVIRLDPTTVEEIARSLARHLESGRGPGEQDTYTCAEFGRLMHRSTAWVQRRCAAGAIKTIRGSRPYQIPASERARLLRNTG